MALAASTTGFKNRIVGWIDYRLPFFTFMHHQLDEYPTPRNLSYWWNFGSLAGITRVMMVLSGITLALHYTAEANSAFDSVEHIMRDVNYGWLTRYLPTTAASMFFALLYLHTACSGSNNPLGIDVRTPADALPFHPSFTTNDLVSLRV